MSHVDEGRLHAFLDGALSAADPADAERVELHLLTCPDCLAKLEEAARLSDEADALLAAARPRAFETPSFDAIRARAAALQAEAGAGAESAAAGGTGIGTGAGGRPSRNRRALFVSPFNGLAWAATVVLAVGLGWLLRDTADESDLRPMTDIGGRSIGAAAPASTDVELGEALESIEADQTTVSTGASEAAPSVSSREDLAAAPVDRRADPGAALGRAAGVERPTSFESYAVEDAAQEESAERDAVEEYAIEPADMAPQASAAPERRLAQPAAPPAPPPAAAASSGVGADAMAGAAAPRRQETANDGWRTVTREEAARATGGELVVIPGARVTAAALRGSGAGLEVRTVQWTTRGESVGVVQRRASAGDPDALESASRAAAPSEAAQQDATMRRGDWTVTISAPVSADRLQELLEELR